MDLRGFQCPELGDLGCENDQLPSNPEVVSDLLLHLEPCKSMGPDEILPRTVIQLADVITRPLSMIFEWSWESGEVPVDWKLDNVVLIFEKGKNDDPGNYRPVSVILVPGKIIEIILGGTEKHLKENTTIGHSQQGLKREKSNLSNLISFYDKETHLADQEKPVDVICLDFSKVFYTISHSVLLDKMTSPQLDKYIMGWICIPVKDEGK
ncbi:RNA-directed DNA polymerase from mobile element jockey-like protein [Pitangus sulphuratus]|nr:RNA-directed DNA polymerase from mobile element jockey-like protein [Pitangus sulphuratus]